MADEDALHRITAVKLTTSDLLVFVIAGSTFRQLPEHAAADAVAASDASSSSRDQGQKALALLSRLQALAELLYDGLPGWANPGAATGTGIASRVIFAAAAEEPLVLKGESYAFERTAFLERVASIAALESGHGAGPGARAIDIANARG